MGAITLDLISDALARRRPVTAAPDGLMPAAVMVLLYHKDDELCVLLNKRSMAVEHHKGEMSFPAAPAIRTTPILRPPPGGKRRRRWALPETT